MTVHNGVPGRVALVSLALLGTFLLLALGESGCERKQAKTGPDLPPIIPVSKPVHRSDVIDSVDFTGRTEAVQMVDVRARVNGYLVQSPFKEGTEVKEGDLLFEVDPRPYKAQLDQATAQIGINEAALKLAQSTLDRSRKTAATAPGSISQQEIDQYKAAVAEAAARVRAANASTEVYKLNLEFTHVTSPIEGQISRRYLTAGNLVIQDQTLLTTIVSLDPIYVYFELDEPTLLRVRMAINEGRVKLPTDGVIPVYAGLTDEVGYPHHGVINFVNNQVNPTTGSIAVRGEFPNPKIEEKSEVRNPKEDLFRVSPKGRLLAPGMFVRVRLPIGVPYPALLVIDRAILSRPEGKLVYVVDPATKVVRPRSVKTGALQEDGLRVISEGLGPEDLVVIGGLQQVQQWQADPQQADRPIQIEERTMPAMSLRPTEKGKRQKAKGRRQKKKRCLLPVACCLLLWSAATLLLGCQNKSSQVGQEEVPAVPVSEVLVQDVIDYVDFTGRTDAVEPIDIRPRVTGYLVSMPFKEGSEVHKGDLLFEIDHRPYKAQLDQTTSQVTLAEASYELAQATLDRDLAVRGVVSQQQLDQDRSAVEQARGRLLASRAGTDTARINVGFTKVTSPITGQVGRYYLTRGNLVNQDQTLLTTVVSLDPIYAYFDVDGATLLRLKRMPNGGSGRGPNAGVGGVVGASLTLSSGANPNGAYGEPITVEMGLQGEVGFPHRGTIDFFNNQLNPTTNSLSVRAVFANPKPGPKGVRLLSPGMFVRIRLPLGEPHPAIVVANRAIASDQGLKYVYVLDANNQAQYRRVNTGPLRDKDLRVILPGEKSDEGLQPDDVIVVGGLQQVRPKMKVRPDRIPMPLR